jgi:monoamine oxidase
MQRREFIASCAALGLAACSREPAEKPLPPGELGGSHAQRGHLLRQEQRTTPFSGPSEIRKTGVLIIGGGIAGLSAGWKLARAGFDDFMIAELEDRVGGNSRYGENEVSRYPLGAHYLPLPGPSARATREMLADFGILEGDPYALRPRYDERYLCATPQERLWQRGQWHDGLLPPALLDATERACLARFQQHILAWRAWRDRNGHPAFAIPMAYSSQDPALLALDRITLASWLKSEGLDCPALRWYLDYACRDDFGIGIEQVSAWAGLHYFVCRDGEAENAESDTVLTAPEGNGWLVQRLEERLAPRLLCQAVATAIRPPTGPRQPIQVDVWLAAGQRSLRIEAEQLIWAGPLFVLAHLWPSAPAAVHDAARQFTYAPWLVANLTLSELPHTRAGSPLAWDNVLHGARGLGYVVATHQRLRVHPGPTVITWYRPLDHLPPPAARAALLNTSHAQWSREILGELSQPHPELRDITRRIDLFRHGHAMVQPRPGLLWDARSPRRALAAGLGREHPRIHLAHADLSGMSLFEEAQYRGIHAAERALKQAGVHFTSSL